MLEQSQIDLSLYRIDRAWECIRAAGVLMEAKEYAAVLNRTYYAIFHSVRAVFALDCIDRKKHSGVISCFQQNYVKTGLFDKEYSSIVQDAFEIRQESDYEDFYVIVKEDVVLQLENAKKFVTEVKRYVDKIINSQTI